MILKENFWVFPNAIPPKTCNEIIRFGNNAKQQIGITGKYGSNRNIERDPLTDDEIEDLKKTNRDSNISWLNARWLYKWINPLVERANRNAGWNFQWDFSEDIQFTRYGLNQYYKWHMDSWDEPYNNPNDKKHGKIRKLSMTCALNDGSEYEGGDLEFFINNVEVNKGFIQKSDLLKKQGSLIVFPSHLFHRVTPVTKGTRYSMVAWQVGEPWR